MNNLLKKIRKLIFILFRILPVKNKIVFESQYDYFDNSKALFEELQIRNINRDYQIYWIIKKENKIKLPSNIQVIELSGNTSLFSQLLDEIKLAYHLNSSKYFFWSYINFYRAFPKRSQVVVNLTHGTPLKDVRGKFPDIRHSSYTLALSPYSAELSAKGFEGGLEKMLTLGYPRNDLLFNSRDNIILKKLNLSKEDYAKIIIWMPTFRRTSYNRKDSVTNNKYDLPIFNEEESFKDLHDFLTEQNTLLIIKVHPAQDLAYYPSFNLNNIKIVTNEYLAARKVDLYEMLSVSDALITDYSSVYIDYLLTNKPIAFTIDDLNEYKEGLGFLIDDPTEYMPGSKINNVSEFIFFLQDIIKGNDKYLDERKNVKKVFHKYEDELSSQRIIDYFQLGVSIENGQVKHRVSK